MNSPYISIIIPVYNHANEIGPCLDSILKQTYTNHEIIVVNDGSTDNFDKKIKPYKDKIKLITQENRGSNPARNRGFMEAQGDYVIFCDADIVMKPEMLDLMLQTLENDETISYVYSSFKFGWKTFKLWPFDAKKLKKTNYIHTSSLIRSKDFPGFDEKIKRLQDWDLWLTLLEDGKRGIWINKILFTVKPRHKHNISEWVPSFLYKLPFIKFNAVKKYEHAAQIIKQKHGLKD